MLCFSYQGNSSKGKRPPSTTEQDADFPGFSFGPVKRKSLHFLDESEPAASPPKVSLSIPATQRAFSEDLPTLGRTPDVGIENSDPFKITKPSFAFNLPAVPKDLGNFSSILAVDSESTSNTTGPGVRDRKPFLPTDSRIESKEIARASATIDVADPKQTAGSAGSVRTPSNTAKKIDLSTDSSAFPNPDATLGRVSDTNAQASAALRNINKNDQSAAFKMPSPVKFGTKAPQISFQSPPSKPMPPAFGGLPTNKKPAPSISNVAAMTAAVNSGVSTSRLLDPPNGSQDTSAPLCTSASDLLQQAKPPVAGSSLQKKPIEMSGTHLKDSGKNVELSYKPSPSHVPKSIDDFTDFPISEDTMKQYEDYTAKVQAQFIEDNEDFQKRVEHTNEQLHEMQEQLVEMSLRLYTLNNDVLVRKSPLEFEEFALRHRDPSCVGQSE
eukprot:TRINITY_DN18824_c0_g1_i1.p1 TRINITY_DN18824_c0_g1~~TRINITY_DN18824_c0_g1_i1.p1  ORF type:complete len:440 (-),score=6.74 TRINITY_DN18824_c0_g1_i1:47-1366(-)